jgi:hypothetical protein
MRSEHDPVMDRVKAAAAGLEPLVARAEAVRQDRIRAADPGSENATGRRGAPRWTDVFTTQFTEFSNRPR